MGFKANIVSMQTNLIPSWKAHAAERPILRGPFWPRWLTVARVFCYWVLLAWLVLPSWLLVGDIFDYHADWDTYRRVYRDPALYHSVVWVEAILHCSGTVAQASGWRTARTSWIAVAVVVAFACFQVIGSTFGLIVICCG